MKNPKGWFAASMFWLILFPGLASITATIITGIMWQYWRMKNNGKK